MLKVSNVVDKKKPVVKMGRRRKCRRRVSDEEESDEEDVDWRLLCDDREDSDDSLSSVGSEEWGVKPWALEREWDRAVRVLEDACLSDVEILSAFLHSRKTAGDVGELLLSGPSLLRTPREMDRVIQARGKKGRVLLVLPMLSWVDQNGLAGRPPKDRQTELHLRILFIDFRGSWERGAKAPPTPAWIYDPVKESSTQQIPNLYLSLQKVKNTRLNLTPRPKVITGEDPAGSNDCVGQCCRYIRALASRAAPRTAQSLVQLLDDPLFRPK